MTTEKKEECKQCRWRSKVLWTAIIAQVCAILVMCGVLDSVMSEQVQAIAGAALQLLAILGIVNNPTDGANL